MLCPDNRYLQYRSYNFMFRLCTAITPHPRSRRHSLMLWAYWADVTVVNTLLHLFTSVTGPLSWWHVVLLNVNRNRYKYPTVCLLTGGGSSMADQACGQVRGRAGEAVLAPHPQYCNVHFICDNGHGNQPCVVCALGTVFSAANLT